MATVLKVLIVTFAAAVALAAGVSAETHHVVGGPDFNVSAWLLGRLFTVGDKLRFEYAGEEDGMVEVRGADEMLTCNLTNPIRMLTDPASHVALEEEGIRYFASGNQEKCMKGLKLPVSVQRADGYDPYKPDASPSPPWDPYKPDAPAPPFEPYKPDVPSPPWKPDVPSPPWEPYKAPPPPSFPSAGTRVSGLGFAAAAAAVGIYCLGI